MPANYNNPDLGRQLIARINDLAVGQEPMTVMEVCGTHTMAVGRFGIRRLLPDNVRLISGPGCPVCVTPGMYIDNAVAIAREHGVTLATYGDMVRVPGIQTSLEQARSEGCRVQVVTTPLEVLEIDGPVMMLAVGFETTIAPLAAVMKAVDASSREDITFYTSMKVVPPTLDLLLDDEELGLNGFLLPGHVSIIIGSDAYKNLAVPGVIAGFEMIDILDAIVQLLEMRDKGQNGGLNRYGRVVTPHGNHTAQNLIAEYLEPTDQLWRGLGALPGCSLGLKNEYSHLDAEKVYNLEPLQEGAMPSGCGCGAVLKGTIHPDACALFADVCTPDHPVGPCMVSSEGSCAAYFKYEREA